jgi:hypothetical protein
MTVVKLSFLDSIDMRMDYGLRAFKFLNKKGAHLEPRVKVNPSSSSVARILSLLCR